MGVYLWSLFRLSLSANLVPAGARPFRSAAASSLRPSGREVTAHQTRHLRSRSTGAIGSSTQYPVALRVDRRSNCHHLIDGGIPPRQRRYGSISVAIGPEALAPSGNVALGPRHQFGMPSATDAAMPKFQLRHVIQANRNCAGKLRRQDGVGRARDVASSLERRAHRRRPRRLG